jgi:hypothetical protein
MDKAPKGQLGIQASHPVQVSLSINNFAIRSSYDQQSGILEFEF